MATPTFHHHAGSRVELRPSLLTTHLCCPYTVCGTAFTLSSSRPPARPLVSRRRTSTSPSVLTPSVSHAFLHTAASWLAITGSAHIGSGMYVRIILIPVCASPPSSSSQRHKRAVEQGYRPPLSLQSLSVLLHRLRRSAYRLRFRSASSPLSSRYINPSNQAVLRFSSPHSTVRLGQLATVLMRHPFALYTGA